MIGGGRLRGRALLITAACVAVLLVAGRWLAVETAERAWAATVRGGPVYLDARSLQRLLHWLVMLVSVMSASSVYAWSSKIRVLPGLAAAAALTDG